MTIVRGIVDYNDRDEMIVRSPGHIYHLNNESFFSRSLKKNDKVLGVLVDNKFSVCREFIDSDGKFVFGFVINELLCDLLQIQIINEFNPNTFNPYEANYICDKTSTVEIT